MQFEGVRTYIGIMWTFVVRPLILARKDYQLHASYRSGKSRIGRCSGHVSAWNREISVHTNMIRLKIENIACAVTKINLPVAVQTKIGSSSECTELRRQFRSNVCCHLLYQPNTTTRKTNDIQDFDRIKKQRILILSAYNLRIKIKIRRNNAARTVHHLLMQWIFKIVLIPDGILSIGMPRKSGGENFAIVQECYFWTFGALVANALLQQQPTKKKKKYLHQLIPFNQNHIHQSLFDIRSQHQLTDMTIALRGSMTRSFRSFDVVAISEPSRLMASE